MTLLERDDQVATVVDRFGRLDEHGHLVLISGEAGAGKSALVQELLDHHLVGALLMGRCDDLFAPRPLGPLADMTRGRTGPLADALAAGDSPAVFDAFLAEVSAPPSPTIVVFEDVQWADEATLDLVRFVSRRLADLPCLILATHRDDLTPDHPTQRAIGSLVGPMVTRLPLAPLSMDAVRTLVGDRPVDAQLLHARTAGNPFFLVESLASTGELPGSVRDLTLARTAPLSGAARDALDAAAVLGHHTSTDLLQAVGDCDAAAVDECVRAGLLVDDDGRQAFRHDLSREVVEQSLTPLRRRQLHTRALAALGAEGDVVQRAHHAVAAGDTGAVVSLASRAADQCVALGAWRQAATWYEQAIDNQRDLPAAELLRLLQARATTCMRLELVDDAVTAGERAFDLLVATGDEEALAEWEAWLSVALHHVGRAEDAVRAAASAVARVEHLPDSPALATALSNLTGSLLVTGRYDECAATARHAIELADRLGLEEQAIYALNSYGAAVGSALDGDADVGAAALRDALDRAKAAGLMVSVARASTNLASVLAGSFRWDESITVYDEGIRIADDHEMTYQLNCLRTGRAENHLFLADWEAASIDLFAVRDEPRTSGSHQCIVLALLGRIWTRTGDPRASDALDEAMALGVPFEEPQMIVPIHVARAEQAWLADDLERAAAEVAAAMRFRSVLEIAASRDLAQLAMRVGSGWPDEAPRDEVTRLIVTGDHSALARFWEQRGLRYAAADAFVDSDDVEDVHRGYEQLTALGARPRAQQAARRLRDLGERVARGPRPTTKANAAGLTARETEVAALVARGLTNAEIAGELIVSAKTVDHHVSSVLTKLGIPTRRQVGDAAMALGVDLRAAVATTEG